MSPLPPSQAKVLFIQKKREGFVEPFQVFQKLLKRKREAFFLESFEEWDGGSPYSYIGIDPFEVLVIRDGIFEVYRDGKVVVFPGDGFKNLTTHLDKYHATSPGKREIPFRGGAVGFVGYEAAAIFEKALGESFSYLDKGDVPQVCLMLFKGVVAVSQKKDHVVVTQCVFLDEQEFKTGVTTAELEIQRLEDEIFSGPEYKLEAPFDRVKALKVDPDDIVATTSLGRNRFEAGVKKIKQHIRAGDIFQAVLSDRFRVETSLEPLKIYEKLRLVNPSPFMFFLSTKFGTLVGASPERLVKVTKDGLIETNPIAGTRPRGKNKTQDLQQEKNLLASVKEKAEHLMLVDLGRNDVGRVAESGSVNVEEFMTVRRFSDVMHLISKVRGRLAKKYSPWDALASAFPAGTLSGAPKIRAMEILSEIEKTPRLFYGGAIVRFEFGGDLDSCISIRCGHLRDGVLTFQSGAGIVADSVAKREYDEVLAKSRALRRALVLAEMETKG